MEEFINLTRSFLNEGISGELWYQNIKDHILAIILYGSTAKGTRRTDSDIDLLFILPIEIEEKYTEGEYFINYGGYQFNIVMRSIEGLRNIADGEHDSFQAEVFRKNTILWEKNDEVRELIERIKSM